MKKLDTTFLKKSLFGYIFIVTIILFALVLLSTHIAENEYKKREFERYAKQVTIGLEHVLNHYKTLYIGRINSLVEGTDLEELLVKKDRVAMYKLLKPKFDSMQNENPNFKVIQIHWSDGSSFLRVHQPKNYGDTIAKHRVMLQEIHKNHKMLSGYETGLYATAYRMLKPIFSKKGDYIGAIEFGLNPSFMLDAINEINGFDGMVFIKEDELKLYSKPSDISLDGYRLQSNLTPKLKKIYAAYKNVQKLQGEQELVVDGKKYVTHLVEIKDFQGNERVKLIFFQELETEAVYTSFMQYLLYLFMLFSLVLFIWLVYRRINLYQRKIDLIYERYLLELSKSENYLQSVFDVVPNIMITTTGDKLDKANLAMLQFFDYQDASSFKKEHICVGDFFLEAQGCITYTMGDETWLTYILKRKGELHKVCMQKEEKKHYFTLDAHELKIDNEIRSVVVFNDITTIHELELELLFSKHQFELFMANIPASVFIKDADGAILYANNKMSANFHNINLIGLTAKELLPYGVAEKIKKFDMAVLKNGRVDTVEKSIDTHGDVTVYRVLGFLINEDGVQKIATLMVDITVEYMAQKEIVRLKSAINRSPISVIMTNVDGVIEYVNPNYEKVSGYTQAELIGKNPNIFKSGNTSDAEYKEMWEDISSGKVWSSETKNIAKDGSEFWEKTTIVPSIDDNLEVDGYIAFKIEISDKIALQEELKSKEEMMIAQSRHAAMGEMISMIAHQWRQPVSVIAMYANNILVDIELEELDNEKLKKELYDVLAQTEHLSQTIDDFRNFFKPNKSQDSVVVSDVFNEALAVMSKSLADNNIEVINEFETTTQLMLFSRELLQVCLNLLNNAKEALVENRETQRKIVNKIYENRASVVIEIYDNGGGIAKEDQEKVFHPYFSTKNEKDGTGLGLYMSKTIVEKHLQGRLTLSNVDEGVCAKIELPLY